MPNLLFCVGKAVADVGLAELIGAADGNPLVAAGLVGKIAFGAWKQWKDDKKQDKLNADVLDAAKKSFEEAKQAAVEVARQVTSDPELQGYVERFVTLVPANIRASLRRPEDITGTTLPANYAVDDFEDLVKLLPARLPRFKPGDTPAFLRGWRLVEQIGAGGFGEVWKAQNTRAGNLVNAVKFGHGLSEAEQTLLNEGDVLNRILGEGHHDGIVKLLDVWADGDAVPWLRYEYIAGGDLTAQIHQWQRLPAEQRIDRVLDALTQIAGTVGHFHTLNPFIVHRDLKPSNILFDPKAGRFKVADFGIGGVSSRRLLSADGSKSLTAGAVVASYLRGSHTPLYASPQQRAGSKLLDPRDDVHALGVIAFQMVTGQLDTAPGSDVEHDLEDAGAPTGLIALVKSCTANKPDRRPKNAAEVVERLRTLGRVENRLADPPPGSGKARTDLPLKGGGVAPTSPLEGEVGTRSVPGGGSNEPPPAKKPNTPTSPLAGEVAGVSGANPAGGGAHEPLVPLIGATPKLVMPPPTPVRNAGDRFDLELPGGLKMKFTWCPPGTFLMGSRVTETSRREDEYQHEVRLSTGFYIGVHPVTQSEWQAVTGVNWSPFLGNDMPVLNVSWDDAQEFCKKVRELTSIQLRLPTEAEWEYACRGGTTMPFYWGHEANGTQANCDGNYPYGTDIQGPVRYAPAPVGSYAISHPHPWGLADMHGNVWEWCEDCYDPDFYKPYTMNDPVCYCSVYGGSRVLRGGSWNCGASWCRSATRNSCPPARHEDFGFRVVFNPD